jgi:PEGA domain-containing protein
MDSELIDPASDSLQGFASEASIAPTRESEPPFLRTPSFGYVQEPNVTLDTERHSQTGRVWLVATVSVVAGVLAGFAAGYAWAHRITVPAVASAPVPAPPSASRNARAERAPETPRDPNIVAPAPSTNASAVASPSSPSSTIAESRTANPASRTRNPEPRTPNVEPGTPNPEPRFATTTRPAPIVVSTAGHAGAIEILSNPRGARVLLDGNVVGRAPMSIADVSEGTHEVRLELDGFKPWIAPVRVSGGSRARVGASLEP